MITKDPSIPETPVDRHYVEFQHHAIEFLVAQLIDFRKVFEGDLDESLIFLTLARYHLREERIGAPDNDLEYLPVHSLPQARISEITEIPRETTRRKLLALEKRGLIEKDAQDRWRIATRDGVPVIRTEYADYWRREMQRLLKLIRALKPYV
ncbi:hypothetical protein ACNHKD_17495 [Methylocystis sp. JAN1]|uniref:hypothetical protein n=1 Tax=Methylocystis sp. JAN1 TaxID=3397211 RepID=UPI003FA2AEA9